MAEGHLFLRDFDRHWKGRTIVTCLEGQVTKREQLCYKEGGYFES